MKLNETINIVMAYNEGTPTAKNVPAKRVYIHEAIKTYLHRPIDVTGETTKDGWVVTEFTTGLKIACANTIKQAIEKAEENAIRLRTILETLTCIKHHETVNV